MQETAVNDTATTSQREHMVVLPHRHHVQRNGPRSGCEGPLSREDIIDRVKRERYVKDATIAVNLQSNAFSRLADGRYALSK